MTIPNPRVEVRPNQHPNNEISFLWKPGILLADLVHQADVGPRFVIREGGTTRYAELLEAYKPLSWLDPLISARVLRLPSRAEDYGCIDDLASDLRAFIHRYFDCSDELESVATLYVLSTWMYECFESVPYLRFMGLPGIGKTRGLHTIGAACNRPLVIAGTSSVAVMYRQIEATGGTVLVDEADYQNSQIGSDITRILNSGYQRGTPVLRTQKVGDDWVPRPYIVFGPKIISGRKPFSDDAVESRCLAYTPQQTGRTDVPKQLPESFHAEALSIRNRALAWRLEILDTFSVREILTPTLRPRTSEIIMPLLNVAELMQGVGRDRYRGDLIAYAKALDEQAAQINRNSVEAMLVAAYVDHCRTRKSQPTCGGLAADVHHDDESTKRWLNARKTSELLRGLGFTTQHTKRGSEVNVALTSLALLCKRYGV